MPLVPGAGGPGYSTVRQPVSVSPPAGGVVATGRVFTFELPKYEKA